MDKRGGLTLRSKCLRRQRRHAGASPDLASATSSASIVLLRRLAINFIKRVARVRTYRLLGDDALGGRGGRAGGLLHGHGLGIPRALGSPLVLGGLEPAEEAVVEHGVFLLENV